MDNLSLLNFTQETAADFLSCKKGKNTLYSPMSLYFLLGVLETGTGEETKGSLRKLLDISHDEQMEKKLRTFQQKLSENKEVEAYILNSLWIDNKNNLAKGIDSSWLNLVKGFDTDIFAMDFSSPKTKEAVSSWVDEKSKGKISYEPDLDIPNLYSLLINLLYYKAKWKKDFKARDILKNLIFTNSKNKTGRFTFLRYEKKEQHGHEDNQFSSSYIPLKSGSVYFVQPNECSVDDVLCIPDLFDKVLNHNTLYDEVGIIFPEVCYETDMRLSNYPYGRKIKQMLADGNFENMFNQDTPEGRFLNENVVFNEIIQKTFIELNRKGVEASAMTSLIICGSYMDPTPKKTLTLFLNSPFIYMVVDENKLPLMVGVVRTVEA